MKKQDNCKGLTKKFLNYLLPSISAMWVFSIYTMVDGIFVGKRVGPIAIAAVNLSMPFINTIFGIALLIAISSSTLISIFLGRKETQKSNELFTLHIIILLVLATVITSLSLLFLENLATFLGADARTLDYVKDYLQIIITFSVFFMVAYSLEVLVKTDGFPTYAIVFVSVAAATNIILDYVFVMVFNYGIKGAALATGISQLVSCLGLLAHFLIGKSKLKFVKVKFDWNIVKSMFTIGFPDAVTEFSAGITVYLYNYILLRYIGADGIAAFSVIMYLNNLVIMTMVGITQGMQPLVSFFYGGGDKESIKRIFHMALKSVTMASILFIAVSQCFTDELISMFIDSSNNTIYQLSKEALHIFSFSFLLCGFNIVISGYFTARKETKKATLISMLRGLILIAAFVLILPPVWGGLGIWISSIFNEMATLLISLLLLTRSKSSMEQKDRRRIFFQRMTRMMMEKS
ncbi:MATE family efflux transporter [Clostridiaceae bacterium 35-E11]